jgi:NhaP-type Na+/H+ or K+/H+ antiporter
LNDLPVILAAVGGLLLLLAMFAGLIHEKGILSEPLFALVVGVLVGPAVFGLFDLAGFGDREEILEGAALVTLAVALVGVALRLPRGYLLGGNRRLLVVLLGLLMPLMWAVCSLLAYLILGLPFWASVLVGAILTPTDPVVASTIVTGGVAERSLPGRLRHAISAESGLNDGLALPFILLPLLVLTKPQGEAVPHWLTHTILWEVVAGAALAASIGYFAGKTLGWAEARETLERTSLLTVSLALSLTVLGVAGLVGVNGVLAAFVAGLAFNHAGSSEAKEQQEDIQEAITRFFLLPVFVLLGMAIPWEGWRELGWAGLLLAAAVLVVRRIPAALSLRPLLGPLRGTKDLLFLGWFGPIGVAALYYATRAQRETGVEEVWAVCSLVVVASVVVHGITDTPLTKLYGGRSTEEPGQDEEPAPGADKRGELQTDSAG